jgi:hypothetical protein
VNIQKHAVFGREGVGIPEKLTFRSHFKISQQRPASKIATESKPTSSLRQSMTMKEEQDYNDLLKQGLKVAGAQIQRHFENLP